jgi:acetoin utilization deacetylase AcuC-like enzyme
MIKDVSPASSAPRKPRIMYLDLDLHFSDAVSQAFWGSGGGNGQVLVNTVSTWIMDAV